MRNRTFVLVVGMLVGCAATEQDQVVLPLYVAGTDSSAGFTLRDGTTVLLERAELAFGPLYLCAGHQAGTLCDSARLEWLGSVVVDAKDPAERRAGELSGVTGRVNSWMYDLGLSSVLTREDPLVTPAAAELGGVSLRLEGTAEIRGLELPFGAEIAVQQESQTELGVPVVRKSTSDAFGHDVTGEETGLVVRFDPRVWLAGVNFQALVQNQTCEPPGAGCPDRLPIAAETQAFRSIKNALAAGERPAFKWNFSRD